MADPIRADDGADHVDFPASSPHCLACGGTRLQASRDAITGEVVWNDGALGGAGGGGVSSFFPLPLWQEGLRATRTQGGEEALQMRGVPDVVPTRTRRPDMMCASTEPMR